MQRCLGCMKEYEAEFDLCPFCGYIKDTPAKSRNHLEPGTEIANRYIIGKSLGQGGFGITYIAWDNKIQKTVTIKEFFPNALSTRGSGEVSVSCFNDRAEAHFKEGMKKMLDEGRRLSKFTDNENIVDVYDFFEENNTSYIVMEYLSGKDLKQFLEEKGGKLDPEEAVKIILPILNALSDMHKAQLIHRDVAPDNIFLCDNGKIKLLDFGSARLAVDENEKSLSIMLKHGFAPKEQYSSRSNQGPWTDVYAVCATLYKMITGEVPPDSIDRKSDSLKPLSAFGINGYAALEEVISKGLEVESEDRYQDIDILKNELIKALKNPSDNIQTTIPKDKTNNKFFIASVASIIVFIIIFSVGFANKNHSVDVSEESISLTENIITSETILTTLQTIVTTEVIFDETTESTKNNIEVITVLSETETVSSTTTTTVETTAKKEYHYDWTGTCGDNILWGLDAKTAHLDIWGGGNMRNGFGGSLYKVDEKYTDGKLGYIPSETLALIRTVDIHYGVTSIGDYAFMMFENLKSVSLPNSVTRINQMSFASSGIKQITIPNSVTTIEWGTFSNCCNLKEITIPYSVTNMELGVFSFDDDKEYNLEAIYVEGRDSAPSGWNTNWNLTDVPVIWNA